VKKFYATNVLPKNFLWARGTLYRISLYQVAMDLKLENMAIEICFS